MKNSDRMKSLRPGDYVHVWFKPHTGKTLAVGVVRAVDTKGFSLVPWANRYDLTKSLYYKRSMVKSIEIRGRNIK